MLQVGQRVFAQKGNEGHWYIGTIHACAERCFVIFDDGDDGLLEAEKLRPLELHVGDRVFARLPTAGEFKPATVAGWDDEKIRVKWPDGEEDWTSYGMIRISVD